MRYLALFVGLFLLLSTSQAQDMSQYGYTYPYNTPYRQGEGVGRAPGTKPLDGFIFCRLMYHSDRSEQHGNGWTTDFPGADRNFSERLAELTTLTPARDGEGKPRYHAVHAQSPDLYQCPFLIVNDVGTMALSTREALALRAYLLKGGSLWADDFWGERSWGQWLRELNKIFPGEYQITTPDFDHPIYNQQYHIRETLQITNQPNWAGSGSTTEQNSPKTPLQLLTVEDRVVIVMTHNSDVQDTWEREHNPEYMLQWGVDGYSLGINVMLYLMSH